MRFHEPIKNFNPLPYPEGDVTQFFGENPALYRNCCGLNGHNGWDIVRVHGEPILCVEAGKVVEVNETSGNGKHVRVLTGENEWIYGHLSRIDVNLGWHLSAGEQLGLMGNTGFVVTGATPYWKHNPYAGTHLHLTRYPLKHWDGAGSYNRSFPSGDRVVILNPDNGYRGAADLSPSDFEVRTAPPVKPPRASDEITAFATKMQQEGKAGAAQLFAIAQLLRSFGY